MSAPQSHPMTASAIRDASEALATLHAPRRESGEAVYKLNDLYRTIQGEGTMTGVPMVLVRLHGCPVSCVFCDTKETWGAQQLGATTADRATDARHEVSAAEPFESWRGSNAQWVHASAETITALVTREAAGTRIRWVLLTGGEPAMQDLRALCWTLQRAGFRVALETSGTATGHVEPWSTGDGQPTARPSAAWSYADYTTVSPKLNNPANLPIAFSALRGADEIKFVIGHARHLDDARDALFTWRTAGVLRDDVVISLQPMSESAKATALCVATCQEEGWRLSIQTHKTAGVR